MEHINGCRIKRADPIYATRIVSFFRRFDEVAFCDWLDEGLVRGLLSSNNTYCYVAINHANAIIGAVAGGVMGTRGTINHLAVSPDYRDSNIGTSLSKLILKNFRQQGIRRIFLFIEEGNQAAQNFWKKQGFRQTCGEVTCELDL